MAYDQSAFPFFRREAKATQTGYRLKTTVASVLAVSLESQRDLG